MRKLRVLCILCFQLGTHSVGLIGDAHVSVQAADRAAQHEGMCTSEQAIRSGMSGYD